MQPRAGGPPTDTAGSELRPILTDRYELLVATDNLDPRQHFVHSVP